jgi:hypothetical protein
VIGAPKALVQTAAIMIVAAAAGGVAGLGLALWWIVMSQGRLAIRSARHIDRVWPLAIWLIRRSFD